MRSESSVSSQDDRHEITALLLRYAWAIDSKNWALLRACFTEDCHAVYGNGNSPHGRGTRYDGAESLVEHIRRGHDHLDGSLHRMSNIQIEMTGADTATARTYGDNLLVLNSHPNGPFYESAGYYTDEIVKQDGIWYIATRHYTRVWAQGNGRVIQPDT